MTRRAGFHVVTGAFGYSGRYITQRLLDAGVEVRTLTNSPGRENPFGGRVKADPLTMIRCSYGPFFSLTARGRFLYGS